MGGGMGGMGGGMGCGAMPKLGRLVIPRVAVVGMIGMEVWLVSRNLPVATSNSFWERLSQLAKFS